MRARRQKTRSQGRSEPAPISIGDRLGRFEIVGPVGAGGMGDVYRARDPQLGRKVAIKVLPAALRHDATGSGLFRRQLRGSKC
jgi:eukaryotic-like serine/threonine-protein kinase